MKAPQPAGSATSHHLRELGDQLLAFGAARFHHGYWQVEDLDDEGNLSSLRMMRTQHEAIHQSLNELTLFGLLLEMVAHLAREGYEAERYSRLLKGLVARCRTTHEVVATYLSSVTYGEVGPPSEVAGDPEYLSYFELGAELSSRLPNPALGLLAVWGLGRLAMSPRLPAVLMEKGIQAFSLTDIRAHETPDERFLRAMEILDQPFWARVAEAAAACFGRHPDWEEYFGTHAWQWRPQKILKLESIPGEDRAHISSGGIDDRFENDVANFLLDQAGIALAAGGMSLVSLTERIEVQKRVRAASDLWVRRLYDSPEILARSKHERLYYGERLTWRSSPRRARVSDLRDATQRDFGAYRNIVEEEGFLPIYLRRREDILANHLFEREEDLPPDPMLCFARKQRQEQDGSITLDVQLIRKPTDLFALRMWAEDRGGNVGLLISGLALTSTRPEVLAPWLEFSGGAALSILLDTDPNRILAHIERTWEVLIWCQQELDEGGGQDMLFLYTVDKQTQPPLGLFRPANPLLADAALLMLDRPALPAIPKVSGEIEGISPELAEADWWPFPNHLAWAAKRYLNEESCFVPRRPPPPVAGESK
jgi:hypothetical protein